MAPDDRFALLGVRRIADLSFLTVDREYLTDQGTWTVRDIVRHPGSVVVVPWDGRRITFIRQFRAAVGSRVLELPAGKLDVPGEDPAAAAIRETMEEIGRRPGRLTPMHTVFTSPGFTDETSIVYLAEDLEVVAASPQGAEEEAAEVVAMTLDETADALERGLFSDATTLIGVLALLRRLGR